MFRSAALGRDMALKIILPPGYATNASLYPVVYFLHPWGLSPSYITEKLNMHAHLWRGIADEAIPPMVVVLPAGDKSFFIDAADPAGYDWSNMVQLAGEFFRDALDLYGLYGTYLREDVCGFVENHYAVRSDVAGRAIGGISMGGAGAAVHAFHTPGAFCAVGIHSPALFPGPPGYCGPPWIFGVDAESFAERNPSHIADSLIPGRHPRMYLDCAAGDPMIEQVETLHHALNARHIEHTYLVEPGAHDKTYWEPRMPRYLAFYASDWVE